MQSEGYHGSGRRRSVFTARATLAYTRSAEIGLDGAVARKALRRQLQRAVRLRADPLNLLLREIFPIDLSFTALSNWGGLRVDLMPSIRDTGQKAGSRPASNESAKSTNGLRYTSSKP